MSYTIKTQTKKSWKLVIELDLKSRFSYEQLYLACSFLSGETELILITCYGVFLL